MIAEKVLGGLLIVCRGPIAGIVLKVRRIGIREVRRAAENIVVHRRQIVAGRKHVVQVVIVVPTAVWIAVIGRLVTIGIAVLIVSLILIVALILIVLILIVGSPVVAVPKISKTAAVAKIVAHDSSNDGCFGGARLSTGETEAVCYPFVARLNQWRTDESAGSFGVCEKQRSTPSGFALHGSARFAAARLLSPHPL